MRLVIRMDESAQSTSAAPLSGGGFAAVNVSTSLSVVLERDETKGESSSSEEADSSTIPARTSLEELDSEIRLEAPAIAKSSEPSTRSKTKAAQTFISSNDKQSQEPEPAVMQGV